MESSKRSLNSVSDYLAKLAVRSIEIINSIPIGLFLFTIFFISFATIVPRPNEENYLALSKYFMDKSWIKDSINFNEVPGTRVLYQMFIGSVLKFLSFEYTVLFGRSFIAILYAYSLGRLLKSFSLKNTTLLLIFPIFFFQSQSYFAGSWIFLSVEAKCFAYFFVFMGLYYFINNDWKKVVIFLAIATHFHVLIGGFTFAYLMAAYFLFGSTSIKNIVKLGGAYALSITPFLLFISSSIIVDKDHIGLNPDWIYTYFRNAHHTVMYIHWGHFKDLHLYGVIKSIVSCVIVLVIYNKSSNEKLRRLCEFSFLTFIASVLLIFVSVLDKEGTFLKFYLYRINTLSVLTSIIIICAYLSNKRLFDNLILSLVVLFFAFSALHRSARKSIRSIESYLQNNEAYIAICQDIQAKTAPSDIILYLAADKNLDGNLDLNRKTERSRFVVHKFVPAERSRLNEWYDRLMFRNKILKNIDQLKEAQKSYRIDYVLTERTYNELELVSENHPYKLYKAFNLSE